MVCCRLFTFPTVVPIADQEHNKNQEDEEETAEEDREERHAGSDAEGAEAECKRQRAENQQGGPRFNLNTDKTTRAMLFCLCCIFCPKF